MPYPLQDVDVWLLDSLVIPASLHDVDGRFVHVNPAAERASGTSNAQWLGRHFTGQSEILDLIASGLSTAEIAKQLTLSTETVRNHLRSLFRELHVHTRPEAIAAARRLGLLAPAALGPQPRDPGSRGD